MITLRTTSNDGTCTCKEMTFSDNREAADMLRQMFGTDALATEAQHIRNQTNSALRAAYHVYRVDEQRIQNKSRLAAINHGDVLGHLAQRRIGDHRRCKIDLGRDEGKKEIRGSAVRGGSSRGRPRGGGES